MARPSGTQRITKPGAPGLVAEKEPGANKWVGVLTFTARDLRGIALALGHNDAGGPEMDELADWLDELNDSRYLRGTDDDEHH